MKLMQSEQAELLQGIVELDEMFFCESHKGSRSLPFQRRSIKRGSVRKKRLKASQVRKPGLLKKALYLLPVIAKAAWLVMLMIICGGKI